MTATPLRLRPCDRCGEWRELRDAECAPCRVGAEAVAVADLEQAEHLRSQLALEAWLGVQSHPVPR